MDTIAQQESLVKESLFQFVTKNIPSADLNLIDEIVLSYVISIVEQASQDPSFDVEDFVEMMAAYYPEFSAIDQSRVCDWLFQLEAEVARLAQQSNGHSGSDSSCEDKLTITLQSLSEMLPQANNKGPRSHTNSESSDCYTPGKPRRIQHVSETWSDSGSDGCGNTGPASVECGNLAELCFSDECDKLQEIFPGSSAMEIKHCVTIANGDIERATQILMHREDCGQSLTNSGVMINLGLGANKQPKIDDAEIKNRIIARYSYVDKNAESKEHRPLAPKMEPKKMVRYRDNKIVSLKGERYTEVSKTGGDEEQLKKPKRQHCP